MANDEGWVSVGDVADTAEFAVQSIRRWWNQMGRARFPDADRLLITADAGGSNGYLRRRTRVSVTADQPSTIYAADHRHVVEFHDSEVFLVDTVTRFVGPALDDGYSAVIVGHRGPSLGLRRRPAGIGGRRVLRSGE